MQLTIAGAVRRSKDDPPAPPIPHTDADWDVNAARDWWAKTLFGKTFIEARSFFMIYRWALHAEHESARP